MSERNNNTHNAIQNKSWSFLALVRIEWLKLGPTWLYTIYNIHKAFHKICTANCIFFLAFYRLLKMKASSLCISSDGRRSVILHVYMPVPVEL